MATQTVRLSDLAPWLASLGADLARLSWKRPLKAAAVMLAASAKECFEQGQSPAGVPWAPLKRPRANSKGGDKPLRDKGLLMASLTARGMNHIEDITDDRLEFGTNLDYAGIHQDGGTIHFPDKRRGPGEKPWVFPGPDGNPIFTRHIKEHDVTIPARPFLGISDSLAEQVGEMLADEVERQLGFRPV